MRKVIAIILLVAAAAGLVYGILGATAKTVKIKNSQAEGVFNFEEGSFEGSMGFSTAGGLAMDIGGLRKLAQSQRSRQMWLGFGAFAVLGVISVSLLRKKRY